MTVTYFFEDYVIGHGISGNGGQWKVQIRHTAAEWPISIGRWTRKPRYMETRLWQRWWQAEVPKEHHLSFVCVEIFDFSSCSKMASNELWIWYLLVDASGNAVKNASAASVQIPSTTIIDNLCKAVKAENDQPGYLTSSLTLLSELKTNPGFKCSSSTRVRQQLSCHIFIRFGEIFASCSSSRHSTSTGALICCCAVLTNSIQSALSFSSLVS